MTIEEELAAIQEHVAYLHARIPRSKWTRDDQWIVHLTAKIEAVLALHRPSEYGCVSECRETNGDLNYPCPTVRAIEEAGK